MAMQAVEKNAKFANKSPMSIVEPNPQHFERYQQKYQRYQQLVEALKTLH